MWLLINEKNELFHITPCIEHVVSRKGGSLTLNDDQSISRQHAKIILKSENENDSNAGVTLVDTCSKYGTFLNDGVELKERLHSNVEIILKHNDLVQFGLQWNKWRVIFMPLIVMTSMVDRLQKIDVKACVNQLGGKFVSSWSPVCTYLIMNRISLTVKVVCSLAAGQHIVTPQYWKNLLQAIKSKDGNLPDPKHFIPSLDEPTINESQVSFTVNKQRKFLFDSLLFVASSVTQKNCVECMITAAGGRVMAFSECKFTKEYFCQEGILLMQSSSIVSSSGSDNLSQESPGYLGCVRYITSKGLRCIPESDIGLSIVYCSREKFCNPKYRFENVFQHRPIPQPQSESSGLLAPDTEEDVIGHKTACTEKVINETTTSEISSKMFSKRSLCENSENDIRPFKKPLLQKCDDKNNAIKESDDTFSSLPKERKENNEDASDFNTKKSVSIAFNVVSENVLQKTTSPDRVDDKYSPLQSVDIFATVKPSVADGTAFKSLASFGVSSKTGIDIFEVYNNKKLVRKNDMNYFPNFSEKNVSIKSEKIKPNKLINSTLSNKNEDCFTFNSSESKKVFDDNHYDDFTHKDSSNKKRKYPNSKKIITSISATDPNNYDDSVIFKSSKIYENLKDDSSNCFNNNNNFASKNLAIDYPFSKSRFENKIPADMCQASTSGFKRLSSFEDSEDIFSLKRQKVNDVFDKNLQGSRNSTDEIFFDDNVAEKMKQEPFETSVKDENLHDSTVLIIKSLVVPLSDISISNRPFSNSTNVARNFKKFRKATRLRMPVFIDLVCYKEDADCSIEKEDPCFSNWQ